MERRRLGKTGMEASVLGFGGSEIGYQRASLKSVERLLGSALDAGLNVIDTAECYEDSEELIGRAVGGRRGDYSLFTKCGHARGEWRADWRPDALLRSIERSLKRLRTDRVDLVQLHSCSLDVLKRGDAITALETARQRGWTRFIGYSGDGAAAKWAVESGRFDTLQTSVSIADQEALELTLPIAREREMGVIAKRPIANVAWRYARKAAGAVRTALRFTLSVPGVHTAIVGTTKPDRWRENAALLSDGRLPEADREAIRARWKAVARPDWEGQI
jgi:aryl-alcohol dehydrogenase-like predicted oxidoreductase